MHSGVTGAGTWRGSRRGEIARPRDPALPARAYGRGLAVLAALTTPSRSARPHRKPSPTSSHSGSHAPKTLLRKRNTVIPKARLDTRKQRSVSSWNWPRFIRMNRRQAERGSGEVWFLNFIPVVEAAAQISVTRQITRVDVPKSTYFVCTVTWANGPVVRNCPPHDMWKPSLTGTWSPCSWSEKTRA